MIGKLAITQRSNPRIVIQLMQDNARCSPAHLTGISYDPHNKSAAESGVFRGRILPSVGDTRTDKIIYVLVSETAGRCATKTWLIVECRWLSRGGSGSEPMGLCFAY